jgi:hypothetical protein
MADDFGGTDAGLDEDWDGEIDEDASQVEGAFERLLDAAVGKILEVQDSGVFLRFMRDEAPELFPELFDGLPDAGSRRGFAVQYGRALWNVTPLPRNGYRPEPLSKPERNEPCPCGSGQKHKKCCADLPELPPLPPEYAWTAVLEHLPLEEIARLAAAGRVPRLLLAEVGGRLLETGQPERARGLLEGLFERPERWDDRDADALDVLFDAYEALGDREAKREAVLRLVPHLPPVLRGLLWERLALSLAGEEDMDGAWEAYGLAQNEDAASPSLGPVEVSLLLVEERTDEAAERARDWLDLAKRGQRDISPDGITLLEEVAADPERVLLRLILEDLLPWVERLVVLAAAPAADLPAYGLLPVTGQPGSFELMPPAALAELEEQWHEAALPPELAEDADLDPEGDPEDEDFVATVWDDDAVERWVTFLEDHPQALGSLSILDDLSEMFEGLVDEVGTRLDRDLLWPIARRGPEAVARAVAGREGIRLPAEAGINRSALHLYSYAARLAGRLEEQQEEQVLLAQLLAFDPEDPHGAKMRLGEGN